MVGLAPHFERRQLRKKDGRFDLDSCLPFFMAGPSA